MKILVTGGAGFIASHIVDAYIGLGHKVIIVDNLSTGKKEFVNKRAKFYKANVKNKVEIGNIVAREKPDIINHHAAQISVRNSIKDPVNDAEVNILGLLNILEGGLKNNIKKVIFASSGGVVYGEATVLPTPEDYHPARPLSPYGVTKLTSEYYLDFYYRTYKIPYIALRYSNVYGPRQNPYGEAGVVAVFTNKLLSGQTPIIYGSGEQTRDFIFVSDVVEVNILALSSLATGSYNISTGIETKVREIYQGIRNILVSKVAPKHRLARKGEQFRSCLDPKLAKRKLGWEKRVALREGLVTTVEYFKHHEKK